MASQDLNAPAGRFAIAGVGVALLGAALLALFFIQGASGPAPLPGADTLVRIDPKTNKVAGTFSVGRKSSGVAVTNGFVWVTNLADGSISRIDPRTRTVTTIPGQGEPTGIAAAGGSTVIADGSAHKVTAFDSATGALSYPARLQGSGNGTLQIAGGASGIWFADPAAGIVGRVDDFLPTGTPSAQVSVPPDSTSFLSTYQSFDGLAVGEGAVWVAGDSFGRTVWRINPSSGRVTRDPAHICARTDRGRRGRRVGNGHARRHRLAHRPDNEPGHENGPGRTRNRRRRGR